jgi:histone deacetylase 11
MISIGLSVYGYFERVYLWVGLGSLFLWPLFNETYLYFSSPPVENPKARFEEMTDIFPIVYSPGYNITAFGEKRNGVDLMKNKRIWEFLHSYGVITTQRLHEPSGLPTRAWLNEVMSSFYLFKLNYSAYVSKCLGIPLFFMPRWYLKREVLNPFALGTVGSVEAAYLALNKGWAINLGGGAHHCNRYYGEGFCVYPDITFITHYLRKFFGVKKFLIIDLDAH